MAFHAEGMKAQSPATLSTTAGFSAEHGEDGVRPHKMQPDGLTGQHELSRHHDGDEALGSAAGDQMAEGMGLDEGTPFRFAERGVDGSDEHRLQSGSAEARRQAVGPTTVQSATAPISSIDSFRCRL